MGIVLSATSIGIVVRTLIEMKRLNSTVGYTIVGAAILDDIVGIMLLAVLSSVAIKQEGDPFITLIPMIVGLVFLSKHPWSMSSMGESS